MIASLHDSFIGLSVQILDARKRSGQVYHILQSRKLTIFILEVICEITRYTSVLLMETCYKIGVGGQIL